MILMTRTGSFVRVLFCALLVAMCVGAPAQAALTFPALTGRVVDEAGILTPATTERIAAMSSDAEHRAGVQIVVATVKSLQDTAIEDYGYQLGRTWGIGQKGQNNGVILLVAPNERKVRIEVGYGLEGQLTDAQSKVIIERVILPRFRAGDADGGVLAGTAAIFQVITGVEAALPEGAAAPQAQQSQGGGFGFLPLLILFVLFIGGRGLFWPMLFMGGMLGGRGGGYSGGGGFSGGGFSGGGGSFGGGGASGSW